MSYTKEQLEAMQDAGFKIQGRNYQGHWMDGVWDFSWDIDRYRIAPEPPAPAVDEIEQLRDNLRRVRGQRDSYRALYFDLKRTIAEALR